LLIIGVLGALGHGAASLVGRAASGTLGYAKQRLGSALAKATAEKAAERASSLKSAAGSLGKARAEQYRVVDEIRALLAEPNLSATQRQTLEALRGAPEYGEALEGIVKSLGGRMPSVTRDVAQAQVGLASAQAAPSVPQLAAERVSGKAAREAIKSRLLRYGPPALGSAIGAGVGGPVGIGIGALAGAGTRPMVHALRRMVKDPAVQTALWSPVAKAAEIGASQPARALTLSAARSGAALAAPGASDAASGLGDYLRKSKAEREAGAELERLLSQ
jgi:hypothetical protein